MQLDNWVGRSLWITLPFNFIAAYALSFPTSSISRFVELPAQPYNFYTVFSGAMVALFGLTYTWMALQPAINRPLLAFGACAKLLAVTTAAILFTLGEFSGLALLIVSGDLVFAVLWGAWLFQTRTASTT